MSGQPASRLKVFLAFTAIYVVWGSTYLAIRIGIETIPPLFLMGARSLLAGIILLVWARSRGGAPLERQHLPALVLIAVLFFLIGHGLLGWAELHVASGLAAVLIASEALWIAAIESLVARRSTLGARGILGMALGFSGIVLLVAGAPNAGGWGGETLGALAIVVSSLAWSVGAVYSGRAVLPKNPMLTAGVELLIGGILLLGTGAALGEASGFSLADVSVRSAAGLAYLVVFGSVVAFTSYIWLLGRTSATRISTHTYVNPVIALLLGWLTVGEPLTLATVLASAVIMVSVYLVLADRRRERAGRGAGSEAAEPA